MTRISSVLRCHDASEDAPRRRQPSWPLSSHTHSGEARGRRETETQHEQTKKGSLKREPRSSTVPRPPSTGEGGVHSPAGRVWTSGGMRGGSESNQRAVKRSRR